MQTNWLKIAFGGLKIAFFGIVPPIPEDSLLQKFVEDFERGDFTVEIYQDENISVPEDAALVYTNSTYRVKSQGDNLWLECFSISGGELWTYAITHLPASAPERLRLQILQPNCRLSMDNVVSCMMLHSLALMKNRGIFHASVIERNGQAVLFTAPSGTGKSTQAGLWQAHRGTPVRNGDKVLLGWEQGRLMAYGLPFAGTSSIGERFSLPVAAIVVLEQGKANVLEKMTVMEAVKALVSQFCLEVWRREDVLSALSFAQAAAEASAVYRFACVPDETAVICLENELNRGTSYGESC